MFKKNTQKKYLRKLGHQLKPVIFIGNSGLSESVLTELSSTINHHELIKVKIKASNRIIRDQIVDEICKKISTQLVTQIGGIALIYKRNPENPKILLCIGIQNQFQLENSKSNLGFQKMTLGKVKK